MATPQEINKVLGIIRNVWLMYPQLRLCQLLSNASAVSNWKGGDDLFHLSDAELINGLHTFAGTFDNINGDK